MAKYTLEFESKEDYSATLYTRLNHYVNEVLNCIDSYKNLLGGNLNSLKLAKKSMEEVEHYIKLIEKLEEGQYG